MNRIIRCLLFYYLCVASQSLLGYGLPSVALGSNNILDGGPIRPFPGFYWIQFLRNYQSNKFVDHQGKAIPQIANPHLNVWAAAFQLVYQTKGHFFPHAKGGVSVALPIVLSSHINSNLAGIKTSGAGVGDLVTGIYLQWEALMRKDKPLFVHRLEFDMAWPIGKHRALLQTINPGNGFFFFNTGWAATFYFNDTWSTSWRLNYLWCAENNKTHLKAGNAYHMSYSLTYRMTQRFFFAANCYYLQQLSNNRLCGIEVPNSKERVLGIGPGALYAFSKSMYLFGYFYYESQVRNRPQGTNLIFRFVKHF